MEQRLSHQIEDLRRALADHNTDAYAHGKMLSQAITDRASVAQGIYTSIERMDERVDRLEKRMSRGERWQQRMIGGISLLGLMVVAFGGVILEKVLHWF